MPEGEESMKQVTRKAGRVGLKWETATEREKHHSRHWSWESYSYTRGLSVGDHLSISGCPVVLAFIDITPIMIKEISD